MPTDPIIQRIADLLRLAEGTNSPGEAATAAAHAQKLMTKHQITRADVDDESGDIHRDAKPLISGRSLSGWHLALANGIAQSNGCLNIIERGEDGRGRLFIIGREEDVLVVRALFKYLRGEIDRHTRRAVQIGWFVSHRDKTQFRLGAVISISMALEKARKQAAQAHSSTALVKLDLDADKAEQWAKDHLPGLEMNKAETIEVDDGHSAYIAGRMVGERIPLINPKRTIEE